MKTTNRDTHERHEKIILELKAVREIAAEHNYAAWPRKDSWRCVS